MLINGGEFRAWSLVHRWPGLVSRLMLLLPIAGIGTVRLARAEGSTSAAPSAAPAPTAPEPSAPAPTGSAPTAPDAASAEATPPKATADITPDYPDAAIQAGILAGSVLLSLTIDADGNVTAAEAIEDPGYGFGEAALRAAAATRFIPAHRGDTPIASRIRLRVDFQLLVTPPTEPLPPEPDAVPAPAPDASVSVPAAVGAPPLPPPQARPTPSNNASIDVHVQRASAAERSRRSAEAVKVIELTAVKRGTADLGEILARQAPGVGVQREGGLGSRVRISINGLTEDQVRLFIDGFPLELMGFPSGLANVPVNLVERIEVHSGVVPVRFGADALGGAIDLITSQDLRGTHAMGSYQLGSFGTHRISSSGQHLVEPVGFFSRVNAFFDYARNNFPMDVEVTDERGRLSPTQVERFHDAYRASGANVELGFVKRSWAKRLLLRAFATQDTKQYQHNIVMTAPYGGVTYGEHSAGTLLRYEQPLEGNVLLDAAAGYTFTQGEFVDLADCVYDWFGKCVRERRILGETDSVPHDSLYWDKSGFARLHASWTPHPAHRFSLAVAPNYLVRSGDERRQANLAAVDPLTAERRLFTWINGLEYKLQLLNGSLENIAFVKQYVQQLRSAEPRAGDVIRRRGRDTHLFGIGNGLRYEFVDWLYAKASYEFATRLPRPDEVFGDNAFVHANLELEPERSHNANVGLTLDATETPIGALRSTLTGFLREAADQIILLGNERFLTNQNVYGARSIGIEGSVGWTSLGDYIALDGNVTYQDFRNTSAKGTFGDFKGDRIPDRPYLFGNGSARFQLKNVITANDELACGWNARYTHEYFRGWESIGRRSSKQVTPTQLVHSVGVGYLVHVDDTTLSLSIDAQNVTNEKAFDFFNVQRPGRAFYAKAVAEF